jgi:hypothetical protein
MTSIGLRRSHRPTSEDSSATGSRATYSLFRAASLGKIILPGNSPHDIYRLYLIISQGYTSLNRIQSIVYPTAFATNENMLVCGKLWQIDQNPTADHRVC